MTAAAAKSLGIRRSSLARRIVVFIAAIAFALQSFVTQTHIHGAAQGAGDSVKIAAAQQASPNKAPLHDNLADCPFCQAIVHAGVFITSASPLLYLPSEWVKTVPFVFAVRSASHATAHDWQSRAPPHIDGR